MGKKIFIGWLAINGFILFLGGDLMWLNAGLTVIALAVLSIWLACRFLVWLAGAFNDVWSALFTPRPSLRRQAWRANWDYEERDAILQGILDPSEYQAARKKNSERRLRDLERIFELDDSTGFNE